MSDEAVLRELEDQFAPPDIRADAGPPCKDCGQHPAFSVLCEDCRQSDGSCLRCPGCSQRESFRLAAGFIDLLHRSTTTGVPVDAEWEPIVRGMSRHDLAGVIASLTIMAYDPARIRADNGGLPVERWLAAIRGLLRLT